MKDVAHVSLKFGSSVDKAKRHDSISECTPWGSEGGLIFVLGVNEDLVVAEETVN